MFRLNIRPLFARYSADIYSRIFYICRVGTDVLMEEQPFEKGGLITFRTHLPSGFSMVCSLLALKEPDETERIKTLQFDFRGKSPKLTHSIRSEPLLGYMSQMIFKIPVE